MIIVYDLYFAVELGSVFAAIVMQQIEVAAAFGMVEISAANIEEKTGIKKVDVLEAAKLLEVRGFVSILKNGNIVKKQIIKKARAAADKNPDEFLEFRALWIFEHSEQFFIQSGGGKLPQYMAKDNVALRTIYAKFVEMFAGKDVSLIVKVKSFLDKCKNITTKAGGGNLSPSNVLCNFERIIAEMQQGSRAAVGKPMINNKIPIY